VPHVEPTQKSHSSDVVRVGQNTVLKVFTLVICRCQIIELFASFLHGWFINWEPIQTVLLTHLTNFWKRTDSKEWFVRWKMWTWWQWKSSLDKMLMAIDLVNMCCEYIAYTSDGSFPSPEWGKFTNYTIATFSLPKYVKKNDQGEHI